MKRPVSMANRDRRRLIRQLLLEERESGAASRNPAADPADTLREARQRLKDARGKVEKATKALVKAGEAKSQARKRLDELRERRTASLERRSRHEVLSATIEGLERERDGLRRHLDDCAADLRGMREIEERAASFDPSALDGAIAQLEEDLTELDLLETAFQDARGRRLVQNADAKARCAWYAAVADTLADAIARGQCSTCEQKIRKRQSTLQALTKKLDDASAQTKAWEDETERTPGTEGDGIVR